ncbi:hypothetical protein BH11PLA2_BH11PLA2_04140 [soil metagenome]
MMQFSRFGRRTGLLATLGIAILAVFAGLWAQAPKAGEVQLQKGTVEEEETLPIKPKRKIVIEEEGSAAVTVPRGCYYVRMEDLARAAADTKHPGLKALLASYSVAFDRMLEADQSVKRICPIPFHREAKFPQFFGVFPLDDKNEPRRVETIEGTRVRRIDSYEELLGDAAGKLLNPPSGSPHDPAWDADATERYLAAEQLLSAAILFYDTARDLSKRRGTQWERIRADTVKALSDARLKRLIHAGQQKDWVTVRSLGTRMANLYPNDIKLLEQVFAARLTEAVVAANSDQLADLERSRELLTEFESRFPGSKNVTADQVRAGLKAQAEKLYKKADVAIRAEDKDATRLLRTLEILDPNFPGLRDLMGQLKGGYTILNVGVTRLPSSMSPLTAISDADKMAVELMFEGLVEAIPDESQGVRYVPNLAAEYPSVGGGVRGVRLTRPTEWAGLRGQYADSADVAGTLRLYKGDYHGTWAAAHADFLTDSPRVDDPATLRLAFNGSHPYPLSLLNFKILPTRWLAAEGMKPDDPKFSQHPYGTGPYKAIKDRDGRVTAFVANPAYGRRPGKLGQPFIKEIRFVDVTRKVNLPADFKTEQIHFLPDVPTADLSKFSNAASGLVGRVQVLTSLQNRRIYMLAVNHRKPSLRSTSLRRGLAYAIDREGILQSTFRAGYSEFHKPLSGPYPPESWAVPRQPVVPAALFNKDLALAKIAEHLKANGTTLLHMAVPDHDPRAKVACEAIRKQVEAVGSTVDGKVSITLDFLAPDDFDKAVYREFNYDLAYVPFDYPNDWYGFGLAELLDPSASGAGGRNIGGYLDKQANTTQEDEKLSRLLTEVRRHSDFAEVTRISHNLHRSFLEAMPFVPLWQLDRHMVITTKLQISFDDETGPGNPRLLPPSIFTRVGRWKLD